MKFLPVLLIAVSFSFSSCSMQGGTSNSGIIGGVGGSALGGITGAIIGSATDKISVGKASAIGAGVGAGVGILAGGLQYDQQRQYISKQPPIRKPVLAFNQTQQEIDALREQMRTESILGGIEVRPYNDRFHYPSHLPYQGPTPR